MCEFPIWAYYAEKRNESGKRPLLFKQQGAFSGVPLKLPCGQCVECRLERSRTWALRCMLEKRLYDESSFLTLTYDDANVPKDGSLSKVVLQDFMKRLRYYKGKGVRFYACGEYGDRNNRPHYHVLLFNRDFADKRFYKESPEGDTLYTSKELEKIWPFGLCVTAEVTFKSCAYVARYVMKKFSGSNSPDYYGGMQPEFALMSLKPGIGFEYYVKYGHEMIQHHSVIMEGKEVSPPRYFYEKIKQCEPALYDVLMDERRKKLARKRHKVKNHSTLDRIARRHVKATVTKARLGLNKRDL